MTRHLAVPTNFPLDTPAQWVMNRVEAIFMAVLARRIRVRATGLEHLPNSGGFLIAARHYHPLNDAAAIRSVLHRRLHVLVALDWPHTRWQRDLLERLCLFARWPGVLRPDSVAGRDAVLRKRYLRTALVHSRALLAQSGVVLVFPEGYPTIDPEGSRKSHDQQLLPFHSGVMKLARSAARSGTPVPVIPAGLEYRGRRSIIVRFGPPVSLNQPDKLVLSALEQQVRVLSGLPEQSGAVS